MQRKKIVTIGGGTGSFMLLSGLKKYPLNIAAIVSMADDGGSTGRLRDELGVLPPGDVRQCLVALSESSHTLRDLMNYRFESGDFSGHNFGNLLISALEKITGNCADAVMEAARILNVKGEVIPVSNDNMRLEITLNNSKVLHGEKVLDFHKEVHTVGIKSIRLALKVKACPQALERIKQADFIIIGPGDHYGSVIANLLVDGIGKAIARSRAKVIYNCNLTNKRGQTDGYDVDRYVHEINRYIGQDRINFVTYNHISPAKDLVAKYEKLEGPDMVVRYDESARERPFRVIKADLLQKGKVKIPTKDLLSRKHSFIRHDSEKLAKVLNMIFLMSEYECLVKEIM